MELNRPSDPHGLYFEHDGSIQLNISRDIINSYRAGYMAVSDRAHQLISRDDLEDGQAGELLSAAVSNRLSQLSAVEEEDDAKLNQELQNYLSNKSINNINVNDVIDEKRSSHKNVDLSLNVQTQNGGTFTQDQLLIKFPNTSKSSK